MDDKEILKNPYNWLKKTSKKISKKYDIEEHKVITALLIAIYSEEDVYIWKKGG